MLSLITSILLAVLVSFIIKYYIKRQKLEKIAQAIGTPPHNFIFGCLPLFPRNDPVGVFNTLQGMAHKYGKNGNVVSWGIGNAISVLITNAKDVEAVLNFKGTKKSLIYKFISPWLGAGLLTASGQRWKDHRRLITPAFHFKILEAFVDIFNENDKKLITKLENKIQHDSELNIYNLITSCALDNICETSMGIKLNAMDDQNMEYTQAVKGMSEIVFERLFSPLQRIEFLFRFTETYTRQKQYVKTLHSFAEKVILHRREELQKILSKNEASKPDDTANEDVGQKKKQSLLDVLLQSTIEGVPLSNRDIREEVDTFMFAGHDTTTSTIIFTLYRLALHPEIQENVFQSIRSIVGNNLDDVPTYNQLQDLKYLEMVIKETMRLHATIPIIGRTLLEPIEIAGQMIPANCDIGIPIYAMHRSPLLWEEPEKFDPNRFTDEECAKRGPYDYIAFSAGYRNCIGQKFAMFEVKSIIVAVLRHFKVIATEKTKQLKYRSDMVLRPIDGLYVKLEKRNY